jgi:hypothetical protein
VTAIVTVTRGAGVPTTVNAVVTFDAVPSITASAVTIAYSDPSANAAFNATAGAQAAAVDIQVLATIGAIECKTIATVAISGVLATYPQGSLTTYLVPKTTYLTRLSFDVWGGGGGGGGMETSLAPAGKGGGGGLSYVNLDVVPNETLTIIAGTGGGGNSSGGGGGGGGCSEVWRGGTLLVVGAGGGGGGASENETGAAGGGAGHKGGNTVQGSGGGAGQPTVGGAGGSGGANGESLEGGAAFQPTTMGGVPGGAKGGTGSGGGGGGCGIFGGGGGGPDTSGSFAGSGGGGGAGMISGDAGAVVTTLGTTPPNDPRFAPSSTVNTTGASATGGSMTSGGLGHVVISIF